MPKHASLSGLCAAIAVIGMALCAPANGASELIDLQWDDLIPEEQRDTGAMQQLLGIVEHGQISAADAVYEAGSQIVTDYDDKTVRLPGYLLPLEFSADGVTEFLLVPYVGACIHVPPPPANQIVFVTTAEPYRSFGLFEPVYVTGTFGATLTETLYAEVAYAIAAEDIEAYIYD